MSKNAPTPAERLRDVRSAGILTRDNLCSAGLKPRDITAAVRSGQFIRLRRGVYASPDLPTEVADAVRVGGRIACVTLLKMIGVFVLEAPGTHVHVPSHLSRSRRRRHEGITLHWERREDHELPHIVSVADAVRQSVRCQTPRAAIATLDSVVHHRLLTMDQLQEIFRELPQRFHVLLALVDPSAESGPETFMRLLLRALGLPFETQVRIPGIGRVDFVVDGWLIIECDSREFHEGWDKQVEDRFRDMAAARLGYVTIRPLATDLFRRADEVGAAVAEIFGALGPQLTAPRRSQLRRSKRPAAEKPSIGADTVQISGVMNPAAPLTALTARARTPGSPPRRVRNR